MKLTPKVRARIYEIAMALVALAAVYGIVDGDQGNAWLLVVSAVLGMARVNVGPPEE